jgi:tyrosine-protein kinase Etk/Wzc
MNTAKNEINSTSDPSSESVFWQFLELLYQWKKLVFWITGICTIISLLIAFLLPKEYKSIATVVPSRKDNMMGMLGAVGSSLGKIAKDLSPLIGGKGSMGGEGYNYMSILNSRTAMENVVNKFNLMEVYEIDDQSMEKTLKELRSKVNFDVDEFGGIQIIVRASSPILAADMANYFVELLNAMNGKLSIEDARNVRSVIEKRYYQNVKDLEFAEDSLKNFQERYGLFSPSEQAKATVTANAQLESQLWINEIKLGILENQMDEGSQEVTNLKQQLQEIKKKLRDINTSKDNSSNKNRSIIVPIEDIPDKTRQYLDLYRKVELQIRLMEFLYPMFEQAKLQEAKDASTVLVLDKAIPPEKKDSPKRMLIVLSGLLIGLFTSVLTLISIDRIIHFNPEPNTLKHKIYHIIIRLSRANRPAAKS